MLKNILSPKTNLFARATYFSNKLCKIAYKEISYEDATSPSLPFDKPCLPAIRIGDAIYVGLKKDRETMHVTLFMNLPEEVKDVFLSLQNEIEIAEGFCSKSGRFYTREESDNLFKIKDTMQVDQTESQDLT